MAIQSAISKVGWKGPGGTDDRHRAFVVVGGRPRVQCRMFHGVFKGAGMVLPARVGYAETGGKIVIHPTEEDYRRVPLEMRHARVKQWVVFRCVPQPDGSVRKFPMTTTGDAASCINSETWSNFDDCLAAMKMCVGNVLGFALVADFKLMCVDLDKCILPDGSVTDIGFKWIDALMPGEPYIERSISGRGLHLFAWYTGKPLPTHPEDGVEIFTEKRFVVCTGVSL